MSPLSILSAAVKIIGVSGLIGLLVAAHHIPAAATPLRAVALLWFLALGIIYVLIPGKRSGRSFPGRRPWR